MEPNNQQPNTPPKDGGEDRVHNLKMEMDRKLGNAEAQMKKLADTNAALLKQIESLRAPAPVAPKEKPIEDLIYDDPRQAVEKITQTVRTTLKKELDAEQLQQRKQTQTINELYSEFPEFADSNHDLTKKALEVYGKMDDAEKADPKALKLAAYQAAVELDVKPKSRRGDDDSFSFGSTPSGGRPRRDSSKLDPKVADFARLMGVNIDDPKVAERMKARQK